MLRTRSASGAATLLGARFGSGGDSRGARATTKTHQWYGGGQEPRCGWTPPGDGPLAGHRLRVSFVGLGYVGLCTAVAFANRGFDTLGVDVDPERLALVEVGRAPIHEPGLERLLKRAVLSGRLHVSDEPADVATTDVIFLTVGTPSRFDGSIDTSHVERASREVGAALRSERDMRLVVVKSTVVPGTTRSVVKPLLEESSGKQVGADLGLCTKPEFLKDGSAIEDTFHPDKLVRSEE